MSVSSPQAGFVPPSRLENVPVFAPAVEGARSALYLVATVRAEEPKVVGRWLDYLALTVDEQIERTLTEVGIPMPGNTPAQWRWTRGDTGVLPVHPELVDVFFQAGELVGIQ